MPYIHKNAIVPYTAQQMYELINNIEQYPAFLPWCKSVEILTSSENTIEARVRVAKGPWQKSFSTRNTLKPNSSVSMKLLNGPFHHLEGRWHIEATGVDQTVVNFELNFEFNNTLLSFTAGPLIHNVANTLMKAFIDRANLIYASNIVIN